MTHEVEVDMVRPGFAKNAMLHLLTKYQTISTDQDICSRWEKEFPGSYLSDRGRGDIYDWRKICFYTEQDYLWFVLKWS